MTRSRPLALSFLAAACAAGAFAQQPGGVPIPGPLEQTVSGRIWISDSDGTVHLTVNRSETYVLVNGAGDDWERAARAAANEQVEARLRVTKPGPFGGEARLSGLTRHVRGRVSLPMGGAPILQVNKSNLFQIAEQPWRSYLLQRVNQEVEAEVEITRPGMFGGQGRVRSVFFTVRGEVSVGAGDQSVRIQANKSNIFEVQSPAWKVYLALMATNQRIEARVQLTRPGMFGGEVEVLEVQGVTRRTLRLRNLDGSPSDLIPAGTAVVVTGVRPNVLRPQVEVTVPESGARGLLSARSVRLSASAAAATSAPAGATPGLAGSVAGH